MLDLVPVGQLIVATDEAMGLMFVLSKTKELLVLTHNQYRCDYALKTENNIMFLWHTLSTANIRILCIL